MMFAVGLSYMTFIMLRQFPLYAHFLESFYHKWMLNFVTSFFCIYLDDHMVFLLQFVNMVYHIDWFAYIEESLHYWDQPHSIVVYYPFNVLLDSVFQSFVEDFCIYVHQWYWPVVFSICDIFVWFWYQGDGDLEEWFGECASLCSILEDFEKDQT